MQNYKIYRISQTALKTDGKFTGAIIAVDKCQYHRYYNSRFRFVFVIVMKVQVLIFMFKNNNFKMFLEFFSIFAGLGSVHKKRVTLVDTITLYTICDFRYVFVCTKYTNAFLTSTYFSYIREYRSDDWFKNHPISIRRGHCFL